MNDTKEKDEEKTGRPDEEEEEAAAVDDLRNGNQVVAGGGTRGNDDNDEEGSSHGSAISRTSAISASLLDEIRELRLEELQAEWLDAARYDDLTILRAIHRHSVTSNEASAHQKSTVGSSSSSKDIDWMGVSVRDGSGNTALHMAAANGHASVVRWLLRTHDGQCRRQSKGNNGNSLVLSTSEFVMLPNEAGNTALHWAAANGKADVVQVLLSCGTSTTKRHPAEVEDPKDEVSAADDDDGPISAGALFDGTIDVLQKNKFGRSVLTEAFQGDNQDVIQLVLEHPSASEERLLTVSPAAVESKGSNNNSKGSADTLIENQDETALNGTNVREQVNDAEEDATTSIIQDLVFGGKSDDDPKRDASGDDDDGDSGAEIHVRVREVAMATHSDQIVADQDDPDHDRTGLGVWSSSVVAAHWMSHIDLRAHLLPTDGSSLSGVVALELGAGCAVPSLVLAKRLAPLPRPSFQAPQQRHHHHHHQVYASDWNDEVLDNIRHNLQLNDLLVSEVEEEPTLPSPSNEACVCRVIRMDWNDPASWEPWCSSITASSTEQSTKDHPGNPRKPTLIVGADLIYQPSMVEALVRVVVQLLDRASKHARFYYVAPLKPRSGGPELIRRLLEEFRLVESTVAPPGMKRNPLQSQDDDLCFLHFQDLLTSDFRLYEFAWKA